jgi:hypothetical protein
MSIHPRRFSFSEQSIINSLMTITITDADQEYNMTHTGEIYDYSGRIYSTPEIIVDTIPTGNMLNIPIRAPQFSSSSFDTMESKIAKALRTMAECDHPDTCAICLEDSDEVQLNCGHIFHKDCITQIIKNSCPMCRSAIF